MKKSMCKLENKYASWKKNQETDFYENVAPFVFNCTEHKVSLALPYSYPWIAQKWTLKWDQNLQ